MKTRLTPEARETLNQLVALMMHANAAGPAHSGNDSTYGALREAVIRFLAAETGIPAAALRYLDFNWHGNHSFADDAETAIAVRA
jgi:precorrin-4 methylase